MRSLPDVQDSLWHLWHMLSCTLCTVGHRWLYITHMESLGAKREKLFYGCVDKSDPWEHLISQNFKLQKAQQYINKETTATSYFETYLHPSISVL